MNMKKKTPPVPIDPELEREVDLLARETGLTRAEVVRRALRHYLVARYIKEVRSRICPLAGLVSPPGSEEPFEAMWKSQGK